MAERTGGAWAPLSSARVYEKFAELVSGPSRPAFVRETIGPRAGDDILDIGCGPGSIFALMPEGVRYVGFDLSPGYIEAARSRYGDRAEFHCLDVHDADLPSQSFDLVIVMGVLHHLDDEGAHSLLSLASRTLRPSGRMVVLEAVIVPDQPRLARWIVGHDRGTSIRTPEGYEALATPYFGRVEQKIRHDMLRIPYTHSIIECAEPLKGGSAAG